MKIEEKVERMFLLHERVKSELAEVFGEHIFALCIGVKNKGEPLILANVDELGQSIFLSACVSYLTNEFTPEQKTKIHEVVDGGIYEDFKE